MNLAINYSRQAARLLRDGHILIDRFKCPDWPTLINEASEYSAVAVHFNLRAGSGKLKDTDWNFHLIVDSVQLKGVRLPNQIDSSTGWVQLVGVHLTGQSHLEEYQ